MQAIEPLKRLLTRSAPTSAPTAPAPIGLDLGTACVRMIQLTSAGGAMAVSAAASGHRQGRPGLREPLHQLLAAAPFSGRRVVAAVPKDLLHVRTVRLSEVAGPLQSAENAFNASAAGEAAPLFPFDLRDAVVQVLPTGRVGHGADARWEAVVLAVHRRELDAFVTNLHAAGLIVESVDAEPCALYRALVRGSGHSQDDRTGEGPAQVLVDVGRRRTQVVIGRGADVTFIKPIEVGAEHLEQAVVRKLGVTSARSSPSGWTT